MAARTQPSQPDRADQGRGIAEHSAAGALTEAQLELLRDKYVLWERASREGNMELRGYNRRCAIALKALLAEQSEGGLSRCWLIEWPADRQMPVRYWHPTEGHVLDPNHSIRFCRREDAEAMLKRDRISAGARPVEHMWVAS